MFVFIAGKAWRIKNNHIIGQAFSLGILEVLKDIHNDKTMIVHAESICLKMSFWQLSRPFGQVDRSRLTLHLP